MTDHRDVAVELLEIIDSTFESAAGVRQRDPERTAEMIQSLQVTALCAVANAVLDVGSAIREATHQLHAFCVQYHERSADVAADDVDDA